MSRFHLLGDDDNGLICTPPVLIGFDVLQVDPHDLRRPPLHERRAILEDVVDDADMVLPCRRLPDDPAKAWVIVEERGYEGMVAKDPESTYRGGATRAWIKVKVRHEGVFVVGGYRDVKASGATGRPMCSPSCGARRITRCRRPRSWTRRGCGTPG